MATRSYAPETSCTFAAPSRHSATSRCDGAVIAVFVVMDLTPNSRQMIKSLIPPLALWFATKLLETPKAKGALQEVDSYAYIGKRRATRAMKRAGKNAANNPA